MSHRPRRRTLALTTVAAALVGGVLGTSSPAAAEPADHLVINEVYVNGGSAGAAYTNKFVELYNPTAASIELDGLSVQYRSASSSNPPTSVVALTGDLPAGTHYLVGGGSNGANGSALPTPDVASNGFNVANGGGTVVLADTTSALDPLATGSVVDDDRVIDLVGWGSSQTYEGSAAPAPSATSDVRSLNRTGYADTDVNAADFTLSATGDITPVACGEACAGVVEPPETVTIAQIQGTGSASPLAGDTVITSGVVIATYPTGGLNGFYLQTAGSGGADDATEGASDGIFVFGGGAAAAVAPGDHVTVTGEVSEYFGLTQLTPGSASDVVVETEPAEAVKPTVIDGPVDAAGREALEGMLIDPEGSFTVTNNYATNTFGEIGLATGDEPLYVPTEVAAPGSDAQAVAAQNASRLFTLDDASSANWTAGGSDTPHPWLTGVDTIRVGAGAAFSDNVVLDYRFSLWRFQPLTPVTADGAKPVAFSGAARPASPPEVGGDITLGTFNVLNYFTTTGEEYEAATGLDCEFYPDREGNPTTVDECDGDAGPRGAWDDANLARQEAKIVAAINELDADVVSLEEIENSVKFGHDRDDALATLVDALNADAGAGTWAYVPSPDASGLPPLANQDVIRTAFIYQPASVEPVGGSTVLVGSPAYTNAREPLAQAFRPVSGTSSDEFVAIVNHFKSKGSGVDDGTGQGLANPDRVAQAEALVTFADEVAADAGTDKVFLTGDFNAYSQEDPIQVLLDAGYSDLQEDAGAEETYQFGGEIGSLDHVLASPAAAGDVTGIGVWSINAMEPIAYEYSRYNYNVTDFYSPGPYRSSDHDPALVGIDVADRTASDIRAVATPGVGRWISPLVIAKVTPKDATGTVDVLADGEVVGSAPVRRGATLIALDGSALPKGKSEVVVRYSGDDTYAPSETTVTVRVLGH
ncbi:hypothetical protein CLV56_1816 [Mumia flava]|uniref:LTD domain-containing protein n=1 Tax=Mumia flava TaxID=1348852 RepID=A0A2M9BI01_9ACTN|nr:ExeM/NucH family extracellular endonuclease [Mumia flava]PJJ57581.1 hypothetical protein CLV56_1816 [Mumia flava]